MALTNRELLQKATLTLADFGGALTAPLTLEQVEEFLRLAITPQVMLPDVKVVQSNANKWQESKIDFAARILRPGTELTRLAVGARSKPVTGMTEISTVLVRGEVPISDEVMEDQVERAGFADTVMAMIAEGAGRDLEELMIAGDITSADPYLALLNGWLRQARIGAGANLHDAIGDARDYQRIFARLVSILPDRFKRDTENMRFYVPKRIEEMYRDILAARGTPLGDMMLEGARELRYQTFRIKGVPLFPIITPTPPAVPHSFVLLTHRLNLYAGFRRQIQLETFRDPREGGTSFIVTARVDAEIAHIPATALAFNVNAAVA